jgi:hypothetical protein
MRKALRVTFKAPVEVCEERGNFIATCYLLDARYEAPSKHAALERVAEAVQSLMSLRLRDGTLDTFLREHRLGVQNAPDGISGGPYIEVAVMLKAVE